MIEEITIYEKGTIKITNLRAIFAGKTYSVSNITSVESVKIEPGHGLEFICLLAGMAFAVIGAVDLKNNMQFFIYAAIAFALFYFIKRSSSPTWSVNLTTAAGEVKALTSPDQQEIAKIVESLNSAIIQKG